MKSLLIRTLVALLMIGGADLQAQVAPKTNSGAQRLLARSVYYSNASGPLTLSDSFRYRYSGSRGSDFDYTDLLYRDYFFPSVTQYIVDFDSQYHRRMNGTSLLLDTIFQSHNTAGDISAAGEWDIHSVYKRNLQNQIAVEHRIYYDPFLPGLDTINRLYYTYNTGGKIESVVCWKKTGGQWEEISMNLSDFDASGREVRNTFYTMVANVWQKAQRVEYSWYPNNAMHTRSRLTFDPFYGWKNNTKDSFVYSGNAINDIYRFGDSAYLYWRVPARIRWFLNAAQHPDSVYNAADGSKTFLTYNSYDNPVSKRRVTANGSAGVEYYYYEPAPVALTDPSAGSGLVIFPNPAGEGLVVVVPRGLSAPLYWTVLTTAGRIVRSGTVPQAVHRFRIGLDALPAGQYVLRTRGGRDTQTQTFLKL